MTPDIGWGRIVENNIPTYYRTTNGGDSWQKVDRDIPGLSTPVSRMLIQHISTVSSRKYTVQLIQWDPM